MASPKPSTVQAYLKQLTPEQRRTLSAVRKVVLAHLPAGYRESMNWGMITYEVPLERYPDTYNGRPLGYAALAAQKNYYALYLLGAYADPKQAASLRKEFTKRGKKLDMGKSCLRFRKLEDLPLDVIGRVIASTPPETLIDHARSARRK